MELKNFRYRLKLLEKSHHNPQYKSDLTDTEYSCEYLGNEIIISFAGSEHWRDWIINLWIFGKSRGKVKVHAGYAFAYRNIAKEIRLRANGFRKVTLQGYSQGGAIAQVAARDLQKRNEEVVCISLAAPPVGNDFYGKTCKFEHLRIYNKFDIVPHSLPRFLVGFQHYQTDLRKIKFCALNTHSLRKYLEILLVGGT